MPEPELATSRPASASVLAAVEANVAAARLNSPGAGEPRDDSGNLPEAASQRYRRLRLRAEGMHCGACEKLVTMETLRVTGVAAAVGDAPAQTVTVYLDREVHTRDLAAAVSAAGFTPGNPFGSKWASSTNCRIWQCAAHRRVTRHPRVGRLQCCDRNGRGSRGEAASRGILGARTQPMPQPRSHPSRGSSRPRNPWPRWSRSPSKLESHHRRSPR